jgi:hypothetical protein
MIGRAIVAAPESEEEDPAPAFGQCSVENQLAVDY